MSVYALGKRFDGAQRHDDGAARGSDYQLIMQITDISWVDHEFNMSVSAYPNGPEIAQMTVTTPTVTAGDTVIIFSLSDVIITGLPTAENDGDDMVFFYEIKKTFAGHTQTLVYGDFTVHGRAVQ